LAVGASTQPIKSARQTSQLTVVSITGLMILIGLPVTMILVRRKLQPIKVITQHLQRLDYSEIHLNIPVSGRNEFAYLAATVRVMGDKLNVAQQELLEKQRIAQELTIAREIQESILPKACPQSRNFVIASTYSSAKEVGGDYYDFIDFDERETGLLVADVSGKSLPEILSDI
jgi:sigma-B regulation protein RsbU (phosphoserine phosphatase)